MNRVWIEIEKDADADINRERAAMMTRLLKRLAADDDPSPARIQFAAEHKKFPGGVYIVFWGQGFKYLPDNGEWFNLEYLGRKD